MERRGRNARAPVGDTEFDDSGDEDQDIGEFEPGGGGLDGGALTAGLQVLIDDREWSAANPQLYGRLIDRMGMSRGDEISKRTGEIGPMKEKAEREMIANAAAAAERSRHIAASTAFKHLAFTDPSRDSIGIFGSPGTPTSFDSDAIQPGGSGAPEGYHYMPDGTLMADAAHLTGEGYYVL